MAKPATIWHDAATRSEVEYYNDAQYLVTEAGDSIVTEAGDFLVLGDVYRESPALSGWTLESKQSSNWHDHNGLGEVSQSNSGVQRTEQDTTVRTLEDGTTRVLEPTVITRPSTSWTESDE